MKVNYDPETDTLTIVLGTLLLLRVMRKNPALFWTTTFPEILSPLKFSMLPSA